MAVENPAATAISLSGKLADSQVGARNDLDISRHVFFGETSYVVRDPISFEGHNLSPSDYEILTNLRDDMTLQQVFQALVAQGTLQESERDNYYEYVVELQKRNLLNLPITDSESLYNQFEQRKKRKAGNTFMKLLFFKVPLGCPDRFLKNTYHHFAFLFSRCFFLLWMAGLIMAGLMIGLNWSEFTSDLSSVLAFQNLPAILIVMSILKLWHELGHGYACRRFNVPVPSAGLMFMLGTPLAFVDASGSWSLPKRSQRQLINLGGMYFELMITIIATFVWVLAENPSLKSVAHFAILISSVTTIGFNLNPLMKYDGYFVLADALSIPNLKGRGAKAVAGFNKRIFFGLSMPTADSKLLQAILICYGYSAAVYRFFLVIGISMLISVQFWVIGILMGGYYLATSFGKMLWTLAKFLIASPEVADRKVLAYVYFGLIFVAGPLSLLNCPVPGHVQARGVVQPEHLSVVHVDDGGFLHQLNFESGETVSRGDIIGEVENFETASAHKRQKVELAALQAQYRSQLSRGDHVARSITEQRIKQLVFELSLARSTRSFTLIESPADGRILNSVDHRDHGMYLKPGEELLRIGHGDWIVKAIANASSLADIGSFDDSRSPGDKAVSCRFLAEPGSVYPGTIVNISPAGSRVVGHKALTHLAGGFIPVDPNSMESTEPFFEISIRLDDYPDSSILKSGVVTEIRFERVRQTIGSVAYRSLLRFITKTTSNQR